MDFLINLLFNNPYVPYILGGVVLFFLYQRLSTRVRVRVPGSSLTADDLLGKILGPRYAAAKLEKAVSRQKKLGNYLMAGKMSEDANNPQAAVDAYLAGNEFFAAASVLERMGKSERAAELYLQSGDFKKAAQVFVGAGKPGKAAVLFLEKGNTLEAARLFGLAQEWSKAADLYAKGGYPLRAAEAYEKMGDWRKAAECHEKHFMENVSFSTTYSQTAPSTDQRSALQAGRLYEKAGDLNRALQIYSKGSYFKEAGAACMHLKQFTKAAEFFMRAEDPDSAANAYDQAGDKVKAANLRGEVALKQERIPDAARHFQEGQDYLRAAELFESVGMLAEAAGAYEAGESYAAAGSVYVRAGLKEKAAASYERAGELETAAQFFEEAGVAAKAVELYSKAGLTFKSGEAAAKAGERDKAIALLQRVAASDENYRAATELLAKLFIESRMPGLAVERLQKALAGQAVSPGTLDLYYWLAMGYEALGNGREALGIYKKILAEDLQYRDAGKRAARLESPGPPPAAAQPDQAAVAMGGMRARGVATLQICPACGRCYDHTAQACAEDRSRLATPRVVPFVLLDRYRLVRVLGEGGMGLVFEARDQKLDRRVAIKIVNAEEFRDPAMKKRLEREARAVARVQHPGVIGLYDSGELEDGSAFLVMELLEGCDLASLLRSNGRGKSSQVASLLRQAGAAVAAAHNVGVVHRDIKPQNIFLVNVAAGFQVKVLDFGVAKSTNVETGVTRTGMIVGTPGYMAPEQVQGPGVDARTDLYSLAVVGYEALTGQRMIPEGPIVKMLFTVTNSVPPRLSSIVPGIPPAVDEAFARALAKNPASRPPDIERWLASFADQLERAPSQAQGWPDPVPTTVAKVKPLTLRGMTAEPARASPSAPPAAERPAAVPRAPTQPPPAPAPAKGPSAPTGAGAAQGRASPAGSKPSRFVPKEELGRGPLGTVFRAEDQVDGRSVALRFLAPELLAKEGAIQALVPDLKAAAQLSHPNVVKVLGLVEVSGQRCVVTEFVQGRNFAEALKMGHKMTFQQVHGLGRVLAQVLTFVHGKSVVHGSIQPSNVMVASGVVKVADLGLGRLARGIQRNSDYHAPEHQLDATEDLFAMAAVLYHLLTGVHPMSQPQGVALPLPSSLAAGVPEAFDKLLLRCLHPRVELRFASADDVLRELKDMVHIG